MHEMLIKWSKVDGALNKYSFFRKSIFSSNKTPALSIYMILKNGRNLPPQPAMGDFEQAVLGGKQMSDKRHNSEKKQKKLEAEEINQEYMDMPMPHMLQYGQMQHVCPMMYQCPMMQQCPMMGNPSMQMPYMPPMQMPMAEMNKKEWFEEWEDCSEDSSSEYDSDDEYLPEKYYKDYYKNNKQMFFYPPFNPYQKR